MTYTGTLTWYKGTVTKYSLHQTVQVSLSTLATDTAGELDVLGHDGDALGVDRAEVGVLEQRGEVRLGRLLQGHDGVRLEAQVGLEVLGHLAHKALEGQLADQELRRLLVLADLAQCHGARPATATQPTQHFPAPWSKFTPQPPTHTLRNFCWRSVRQNTIGRVHC